MIGDMYEIVNILFGVKSMPFVIVMSVRGFIVYVSTILLVRINRKFLGVRTSSNFILFIMFGSMFATAITSETLFLPIILTMFFLSFVNRFMARLFFHYPWFREFWIGSPVVLVSDGTIQWDNMKKSFISKNDLLNALQTQLHSNDLLKIDWAYLATDGTINFVMK